MKGAYESSWGSLEEKCVWTRSVGCCAWPLLPLVAKTSLNVVRRSVIGRELLSWRHSFLLSVEHQKPDRQKITTPALPQHHPHRVSSPW